MKRFVLALAAIGLLGGCGILKDRRPTTPTIGTRVPVLGTDAALEPDPQLADVAVTVPGPVANPDWPQPGGNISKTMIHVALGESPQRLWSASIGSGNSFRTRLVSEPMVADGRVYTIDTLARVRAFNADTGAPALDSRIARRERRQRFAVRRRRHRRRRPGLCDQRQWRGRGARRGDRQQALAGEAGRPAARRARPSPPTPSTC